MTVVANGLSWSPEKPEVIGSTPVRTNGNTAGHGRFSPKVPFRTENFVHLIWDTPIHGIAQDLRGTHRTG